MNHGNVSVRSGKKDMEIESEVEIECNHCKKTDTYYVCVEVESEDFTQDLD